MRRIVTWALSTVTVLVLLFSYHTSTSSASAPTAQAAAPASGSGSGSAAAGSAPAPSAGSSAAAAPSAAPSTASGSAQASATTVAGDAVMTRFGAVQVQITVTGGKITAVDVLQVPDQDRRDQMINAAAVPILNQEAVAAQSSTIDTVSGATYTSDGYVQSLQSAIDKAHL